MLRLISFISTWRDGSNEMVWSSWFRSKTQNQYGLSLYFGCLNLYRCTLGVWTYTLGVWTYTLGVRTYTAVFWVSELILWVSKLRLWVSELIPLYFGCLNLYFGCLNFQMTPTAAVTTRRQLSHLARALAHSAQGWNIPFGNPSLR